MTEADTLTRQASLKVTLRDPGTAREADIRDLADLLAGIHNIVLLLSIELDIAYSGLPDSAAVEFRNDRLLDHVEPKRARRRRYRRHPVSHVVIRRMTYNSDPVMWITVVGGSALLAAKVAEKFMDVALKSQEYRSRELDIYERKRALGEAAPPPRRERRFTRLFGSTSAGVRDVQAQDTPEEFSAISLADAVVASADRTLESVEAIEVSDDV
jgi:hypothetical protein